MPGSYAAFIYSSEFDCGVGSKSRAYGRGKTGSRDMVVEVVVVLSVVV